MSNFLKNRANQLRVGVATLALVLGASACSHTGQEGSLETQGACMPSEQEFEMTVPGQTVKYGTKDLSHDSKFSNRVYAEDFLKVEAEGGETVNEIVFTNDSDTEGTEIKRYGSRGEGLAQYEEFDTNRVDLDAIREDFEEGYEFAVREVNREVRVVVTATDSGATVNFSQDCAQLNSVN